MYLSNIGSVEVFFINSFLTFGMEGQTRAKGTGVVYRERVKAEFGVGVDVF
jgi:hypothetical protein